MVDPAQDAAVVRTRPRCVSRVAVRSVPALRGRPCRVVTWAVDADAVDVLVIAASALRARDRMDRALLRRPDARDLGLRGCCRPSDEGQRCSAGGEELPRHGLEFYSASRALSIGHMA